MNTPKTIESLTNTEGNQGADWTTNKKQVRHEKEGNLTRREVRQGTTHERQPHQNKTGSSGFDIKQLRGIRIRRTAHLGKPRNTTKSCTQKTTVQMGLDTSWNTTGFQLLSSSWTFSHICCPQADCYSACSSLNEPAGGSVLSS